MDEGTLGFSEEETLLGLQLYGPGRYLFVIKPEYELDTVETKISRTGKNDDLETPIDGIFDGKLDKTSFEFNIAAMWPLGSKTPQVTKKVANIPYESVVVGLFLRPKLLQISKVFRAGTQINGT